MIDVITKPNIDKYSQYMNYNFPVLLFEFRVTNKSEADDLIINFAAVDETRILPVNMSVAPGTTFIDTVYIMKNKKFDIKTGANCDLYIVIKNAE